MCPPDLFYPLVLADHFFEHVWGGSQPGAAGPQQQQQAAAEGDSEDEDEGSADEAGSEDEGVAAGRICRPRPAPLWLTTAEGKPGHVS